MREAAPSAWIQIAILALALAGLGSIYVAGIGHHGMFMWDEAHYAVLGRALAQGDGYVDPSGRPEALRPPVVPIAVAAALRFLPGSDADRKAMAVSLGAALFAALVVYASARAEAGVIGGMTAALLFGTFPEIIRLASYLLTELPLMIGYTAAVVLFHRGLYHDARWFPAAWACFALALLTRYTAVLFGPTCALLVAICVASRDSAAMRRMRTANFAIGPLVAGLILLPMFARSYVYFGDPLVGFKLASQQLPDYSVHASMPALHYMWILPQMIGWLPAAALAAAVSNVLARRDRLGLSCLTAATVIIAWLSQYGWKEPRLVSAALPFCAIILGTSVSRLAHGEVFRDRLQRRAGSPHFVVAAAAVLFLVAVQVDPTYSRARAEITRNVALGFPSFRWAMERVREETPPTAVLMGANCYQMSWYAERPCLPLPSSAASGAAPRDFRDALSRVDYLVATSFERGQPAYLHDQLAKLTPEDDTSGAVWRFRDPRFSTVVVASALLVNRLAGDDR